MEWSALRSEMQPLASMVSVIWAMYLMMDQEANLGTASILLPCVLCLVLSLRPKSKARLQQPLQLPQTGLSHPSNPQMACSF